MCKMQENTPKQCCKLFLFCCWIDWNDDKAFGKSRTNILQSSSHISSSSSGGGNENIHRTKMMAWFISYEIVIWRKSCNLIKCFSVGVHRCMQRASHILLNHSFSFLTSLRRLLLLLNGNKRYSWRTLALCNRYNIHLWVFYGN